MMRRIINEAEGWKRSNEHLVASASPEALACSTHSEGLASAAVHASKTLDAKMILVLTKSGRLPRMIAKYRPNVPVICFCPTVKVGRQLTLCRGLHAIIGAYDIPVHERPRAAVEAAAKLGFCQAGDTIVVAAREDDPDLRAETRSLRIVKIT
jgi:pyruvate kinase